MERTIKVQNFLERLRWQEEESGKGGLTWIELYSLYSIHGGNREVEVKRKKDVLKVAPMLQIQLAEFKKAVREINLHVVPEAQSWRLETSYVMRNRFADAAVQSRQPAIRGMPYVGEVDAAEIMHILLAIRGLDKKNNLEAWRESNLKVRKGDLKLQGTAQKWRRAIKDGESWNVEHSKVPLYPGGGGTHWVLLYLVEHLPHIDTPAPSTCIVPNIAAKSEANVASSSVVFHDSMSAGVKLQALQDQFLVGPMETSSPHQGRKVEAALDALMKFNDTK